MNKCAVLKNVLYTTKKIFFIVIQAFSAKNYREILSNCINEFDQNTYPIQILLQYNGGGNAIMAETIISILSPHNDQLSDVSFRISPLTELFLKQISYLYYDSMTCEVQTNSPYPDELGEFYSNPNVIVYDEINHTITQPSHFWKGMEPGSFTFKNNPRKPTDIVVYTDAFCYSACSFLTKGLKEFGSAILVGFNGDPEREGIDNFEIGHSPSSVSSFHSIDPNYLSNPLIMAGLTASITLGETFSHIENPTVPREFQVDEIDVRSSVYSFYETNTSSLQSSQRTLLNNLKHNVIQEINDW